MDFSPLPDLSQASSQPPVQIPDRSGDLGRQDFLQLLVTQLRNQDPTNPQDGQEFAAQLAQFSSVEQLTNISSTLALHSEQLAMLSEGTAIAASQQAELAGLLGDRTTLATATALIGQAIEAPGNTTVFNGTDPAPVSFRLAAPAADVTITVRDANGQVVRTIDAGHLGGGAHAPAWDGLTDSGEPAPAGAYTFSVEATNPTGGGGNDHARGAGSTPVEVTTFTRGRVDRITIEEGGAMLWMGNHSVPLSDVLAVYP